MCSTFLVFLPLIPSKPPVPWRSRFFLQTLISLHSYTKKTPWWRAQSLFVFSILLPFIPFETPAFWHSKFFPQTLTSLLHWKNFLMESLIGLIFSILLPLIPFEPLIPWHFEFFPQTLTSLHSYIEKTSRWRVQSQFILFWKKI